MTSTPTAPPAIACLPDLGRRTLIMGILNVTPDSFSDGGAFSAPEDALAQAARMEAEGADLLDVGGESTRPESTPVSGEEERARVLAVLAALARTAAVPISIDTYKAQTARAALRAGARIVNDVWGLQREPDIASAAAEHGAPVIIMHNRDAVDPSVDVLNDLRRFFERSLAIARRAGIPDNHVILDPGIGFKKTREQNLSAIARLPELKALGFPVLMGLSRKSLIGHVLDRPVPRDRLAGTIAGNVLALALGADIVRVHDVREHADAVRVAGAILEARR